MIPFFQTGRTALRRPRSGFFAGALAMACLVALVVAGFGCDRLEEQQGNLPDLSLSDDWSYPYYLVIGGGLSETLSVLTVSGDASFSLANDAQLTCTGVNQTQLYDGRLYALCSLSNSVVVYDPNNLEISREVALGSGTNPMALAFYQDQKAYVSSFVSDAVIYYDLSGTEAKRLATIPMPDGSTLPKDSPDTEAWARPGGIVRDGNRVYCALANLDASFAAAGPGLVAVIDAQENTLAGTIKLTGKNTVNLYLDEKNNRLFTVSAGDYAPGQGYVGNGRVEIIDLETQTVTDAVALDGAPFEMVVAPNNIAYLGNGREGLLLGFDLDTLAAIDPIDLRGSTNAAGLSFVSALAVDGRGLLYAAEFNQDRLFVLDTEDSHGVVRSFSVNDGPETLTFLR